MLTSLTEQTKLIGSWLEVKCKGCMLGKFRTVNEDIATKLPQRK